MNNPVNDTAPEIIVGHHSIVQAIKNTQRPIGKLIGTSDGWAKMQSQYPFISKLLKERGLQFTSTSPELFAQQSEKLYRTNDFYYSRPPGEMLYLASARPATDFSSLLKQLPPLVIVLDQVTDINNAAAIARTAAFYGIHHIIMSRKGGFRLTPSCYRIASGAFEFVQLTAVDSLTKVLNQLKDRSYHLIGLSENTESSINQQQKINAIHESQQKICLVFGNEEKGISHALLRIMDEIWPINGESQEIKSLNVSVATAIMMDRFSRNSRK
jgi:23S rRNA (guanosine2251-2'-O)-methyltransferase